MDVDPPALKRSRSSTDSETAYIPDNGGPQVSIIFSLKEEQGALVKALKPFEVKL
jgi:prephenate dehydratase